MRFVGLDPTKLAGLMSTTRVGARLAWVMSTFHSSRPPRPVLALKNSRLPTWVKSLGIELPAPRSMSALTVPAMVPSVRQSSKPMSLSDSNWVRAVKYTLPPASWKLVGLDDCGPWKISARFSVPACVPSLTHSSALPVPVPASALKMSPDAIAVRLVGLRTKTPGVSSTLTVLTVRPSVFQSTGPAPSLALKYSRLPTAVSSVGSDPRPVPARMSRTSTDPAVGFVRSMRYSSRPLTPV